MGVARGHRLVMLMRDVNRRRFLQLAGGSVASTMLSDSIARALAIPANRATGSLRDVEHIVILMQENRSFDHYFGTLRGVRGFGDPRPVTLPSGKPVWHQADGTSVVLPFRPDVGNLGLTFLQDLAHGWDGTHQAFNGGNYDQWMPAKTTTCMAHLTREDIPFHYALADAFTVCDAYHCSLLGPTDPNRYYMWTGWVGNDGKGGGPVIANAEPATTGRPTPSGSRRPGSPGRSTRTSATASTPPASGAGRRTRTSATTATTRCSTSTSTRTRPPAARCTQQARTGTDVKTEAADGFFDILEADVKGDKLPRCRGSSRPRRTPSIRPGPPTTAPGTSPTSSTRSPQPRGLDQDGAVHHLRRERRLLRPHGPPYPNAGGLAGQSTVPLDNELFDGNGRDAGRLQRRRPARTASACACRCSSSRRGARAAGSARRCSTTPR